MFLKVEGFEENGHSTLQKEYQIYFSRCHDVFAVKMLEYHL